MSAAEITGLSHVAIAVADLDAAVEALEGRLGLKAGPELLNEIQGVKLRYIDVGNARIELISPLTNASPIAKFLERNPAGGLHHVAFNTADVDAAVAAAIAAGARQAGQTGQNVHGDRIAFLAPKELAGALVELEEKK